ncbi:TPA: site-specific DNA-methyltransferase [Pseudomonas aeruginosa]|uniref:site-specific DNA-methyltransferase n=1 Tax=Pseudomonas aeruginosa TaxID=287 RepID=UPI000FED20E2|nr:site-specific DNA-methyltransferase [Pseudomonas aeruginosa]RPX31989.1 site-specific DNA-methyltransferase [Pseudomonas aeruginosa]HCF5960132.1 site-specific DNA-methyltransferase [Pseudomonas aeruginosa]HCF5986777.1 site-specific DNA-methyltransferase [Pseudomonas aeruginosa]
MENYNTDLGYSPDALAERQAELLALLRQTAPEVISDNQIDIEKLKELVGQDRIAPAEHYELSWAGKAAARREIQKTTSHTLLPADSNPPQAPHMLIEGENLEVLRALQKSYHGKVKMIYIDPPYNTGSDSFVYPDDYSETLDEYLKRTGEKNEAGYLNKQSLWKKNSKESGQYHSAWLSMMYPRLYLARNLLCDDGVIFISIDDNECANLKLLCDEIFGEENFVANVAWKHTQQSKNDERYFARVYNSLLVYRKTDSVIAFRLPRTDEDNKNYSNPDNDPKGFWRSGDVRSPSYRKTLCFEITTPSGSKIQPPDNGWRWSEESVAEKIATGEIIFSHDEQRIIRKIYLCDQDGRTPENVWDGDLSGTTRQANAEIKNLFDDCVVFDTPKPTSLIKRAAQLISYSNDYIALDFFAGSGTFAQALMELNLEDGGNRQCICVQMPELLEETSEAYKAGYRTIADITRARIDKVIAKLKTEHPDQTADLACAHFTLAPSNFKVWRGDVADEPALRETLNMFQSAEKSGHAPEAADAQTAMLSELLLKQGLGALGVHAISKPVQVAGVTVHRVLMHDDKQLWLCFEPYSSALKDEISKARPAQVVLLNSCFVGDKADELLSNLQLELAGLDIGLTVI